MPKIYEYLGIIFFFYANEHLPIHVHAQNGEYETKFVFIYQNGQLAEIKKQKVKGKNHLPKNKLTEAEIFVRKFHLEITEKWTEFFVLHKKPKNEIIRKKL